MWSSTRNIWVCCERTFSSPRISMKIRSSCSRGREVAVSRKENIEYVTRTLLVVPKAQLKSGVVLLFNVNERICVACLDLSDFRLPASDQLFLLSGRLLLAYHQEWNICRRMVSSGISDERMKNDRCSNLSTLSNYQREISWLLFLSNDVIPLSFPIYACLFNWK